ncbi:MAG: RsmG family class I SAM-dependent methyltransferase [Armatimonadota bacterium]
MSFGSRQPPISDALRGYLDLLLSPRAPTHILGPSQRQATAARHTRPALRLVHSLSPPHGAHVADLGAGAGAFAVLAGNAWPCTQVCAIDRRRENVAFLEDVARLLRLTNLRAECADVKPGNAPLALRHRFSLIVVRALAEPETSARIARSIAAPSASIVLHHTTPLPALGHLSLVPVATWDLCDEFQRLFATELRSR